ncbi:MULTISPECIES: ABC transporter permease [Exiguobacterium]|uniref:ABC transporter permease n=1 Tax=Exiguobacterium TaxID=33986 RepID=UPI001BEBC69A|nr:MULTISPECIES: ABC transporter permease [Exiguobacterium]MCT4783231.1 ABC transporter permease [Exiguobacterium himgiriensis]
MRIRDIWVRRVRHHLTNQWKTWRLLFDWTIILYGVIPLVIFLVYQYRLLWQGERPWLEEIPMIAWAVMLLLLFLLDHFFVWLERADVTLVADRALIGIMKRYSVGYQLVMSVVKYIFVLGLMAPVLRLHDWSIATILVFGFGLLFIAWLHMWLRYMLEIRRSHWILRLLLPFISLSWIYALLANVPLLAFLLGSGMVAWTLVASEGWLSTHAYVSREVEHAAEVRTSFDRSLLSTSGILEKPNLRKRPFYRPAPNRFGSVQRTLALLLYVRTPSHRNLWLRLIPLAITGILLVPSWFKVLIPIYIGYVGLQERNAFIKEMQRHPFFRSVRGRTD